MATLEVFHGFTSYVTYTNTSPAYYDDVTNASSYAPEHVATVAESLRTTRFVVQNVLTPIVATVGLLGNILNILVLFQPSMRTSTNVYLLVLSLADSVFLLFNFILSILDCSRRDLAETAYHFNPYGRFVSNYSGNVAVWVTVVFTVERYIAVCHPIHGKVWCTVNRAKLASMAVTVLVVANTVPTLFELKVVSTPRGLKCTDTEFAQSFGYEHVYAWWYVTVFTFIPLVCLTIFNIILIRALFVATRRREQLALISTSHHHTSNGKEKKHQLNHHHSGLHHSSNHISQIHFSDNVSSSHTSDRSSPSSATISLTKKRQSRRFSREQNKVTLLLVTIVMIFLLCQLPWTTLHLYNTYIASNNLTSSTSSRTAVKIAGNICNLLGLVNASVNFYLYSCFSKRFRRTLAKLVMFWRRRHSSPTTV
ncbi:G-protein coupled receptor daf-37-like [Physella acuta]|uniref:G-protein coupled receptor daf-37-like n=1 Tax=Physella acuta TaxID=109671 RepID=UPI0027DD488A|nr:G-protein coupled receptor daf-37-like [Physella acuta]